MDRRIQNVIVTGASKGIGRGIATHLARQGYAIGLLARSFDLLDQLGKEIHAERGKCCIVECDLRNPQDAQEAIDQLAAKMGAVHGLVNNAGVVIRKDAIELSLEEWSDMVETNLNGLYYATRAALPHMIEQGFGHIVNISSISGKVPLPGGSAYAATKYAVTGFSQSLFQEVRDLGVKVSIVYPGSVDSASYRHDPDDDHGWKVTPEEVGQVCQNLFDTDPATCVSEVEIRPLQRPPKRD